MNNDRYHRLHPDEEQQPHPPSPSNGSVQNIYFGDEHDQQRQDDDTVDLPTNDDGEEEDRKFWRRPNQNHNNSNKKKKIRNRGQFQEIQTEEDADDGFDVENSHRLGGNGDTCSLNRSREGANDPTYDVIPSPPRDFAHPVNHLSPSSSFDDFEDDEEDGLQKFKLDFRNADSDRGVRSLEAELETGPLTLSLVVRAIRHTREETKRKRVETLLGLVDDDEDRWKHTAVTIRSWCDLYDRGFALFVAIMLIWIVVCRIVRSNAGLLLAIAVFCGRVAAKPGYWYLVGRHEAKKRKATMDLYDELNQVGVELQLSSNMKDVDDHDHDRIGSNDNGIVNHNDNSYYGINFDEDGDGDGSGNDNFDQLDVDDGVMDDDIMLPDLNHNNDRQKQQMPGATTDPVAAEVVQETK